MMTANDLPAGPQIVINENGGATQVTKIVKKYYTLVLEHPWGPAYKPPKLVDTHPPDVV